MSNNKQASKAADYVKALNLNPNDFPTLGERLNKNTARHFLKQNGWEYAEQIFEDQPESLACVVEDLTFKGKNKEAVSIWHRNPALRPHIVKEETLKFFEELAKKQQADYKQEIIQNYLKKDKFGPSQQKFLTLKELGVQEDDVIWIDDNSESIELFVQSIAKAEVLGIDTQSIVGQTKFDRKNGIEQAALIQIATGTKVFLLDGFRSSIPAIRNCLLEYLSGTRLVIGHSLDNDIECLLKSLGCTDKQIKQVRLEHIVDVWKLFKAIHPDKRFSNLAFIAQTVLGKQICKQQTLTNWRRRPLRKNQAHYAAMDALVVIRIFETLRKEYGEQMIRYYCSLDGEL